MPDVVLVQMPFAGVERPSIALGILSAALKQAGIPAKTFDLNVLFAERIGLDLYRLVEQSQLTSLVGEWLFARAAFGDDDPDPDDAHATDCVEDLEPTLLKAALEFRGTSDARAVLCDTRAGAAGFVEEQAARIVDTGARVVGCTSMFQQHTASLALLRAVNAIAPHIITVVGGANCAGEMGKATHDAFDWVDYTVTGEIDPHIDRFFTSLLIGVPESLPANVLGPSDRIHGGRRPGFEMAMDLDAVPVPDYDDYFATLEASSIGRYVFPALPFESSRGCWWGAKHHCTFCGLNANGMAYRRKSPRRVAQEVAHLSAKHRVDRLSAVDNIIHPEQLQALGETTSSTRFRIFYETKANLTRDQVDALARSGVCWIQPGIESLHDETLDCIRKGTSSTVNLLLLKHCLELGVQPTWNLLIGIPGERPEWIASVTGRMPFLAHLPPPQGAGPVRFDRFSPYFDDAVAFGLNLYPFASYGKVYPLDDAELRDIAYFFHDDGGASALVKSDTWRGEVHRLEEAIRDWQRLFWSDERPQLVRENRGSETVIHDTRPAAISSEHILSGPSAEIHHQLGGRTTEARIASQTGLTKTQVKGFVDDLENRGLVWRTPSRLVGLACAVPEREIPTTRDIPPWGTVNLGALFTDRWRFEAWKGLPGLREGRLALEDA